MKAALAIVLAVAILGMTVLIEHRLQPIPTPDADVTVTHELTTPAIVSGPMDASANADGSSRRVETARTQKLHPRSRKPSFFAKLGKALGIEVRRDRREVSDQRRDGRSLR